MSHKVPYGLNKDLPLRILIKGVPQINGPLRFEESDRHIEVKIPSYEYEVSIDPGDDELPATVISEQLKANIIINGKRGIYKLSRTNDTFTITDPIDSYLRDVTPARKRGSRRSIRKKIQDADASRLVLSTGFLSITNAFIRRGLTSWRFFNINPDVARQPYMESPNIELGSSGEHLAAVLHKISTTTSTKEFQAVREGLREVVPAFADVSTRKLPIEGKWAFEIAEQTMEEPISPASASDGTIRLLALLVITSWVSKRADITAIEEPEAGLHPHLSEHIVQILKHAAENTQVIVTTHNPQFLDFVEPKNILLCDKIDGLTNIRNASDQEDIEIFRKHFSLGDLWTQGALGGIP